MVQPVITVWGTNTKTPSLMVDVASSTTRGRDNGYRVVANIMMGHKNGGPNKRALDFEVAARAHEHFGYGFDVLSPIISLRCATNWLHTVVDW